MRRGFNAGQWPNGPGHMGARRVDAQGVVRKISVIPKPYQQPHPPLFQPFSGARIRFATPPAPALCPGFSSPTRRFPAALPRLSEVAQDAGRSLTLGESVGAFRSVHFGKTEAEAVTLFSDTNFRGFKEYFSGLALGRRFARWKTTQISAGSLTPLPLEELTVERLLGSVRPAGTPEQCARKLTRCRHSTGVGVNWSGLAGS